MVFGDDKQHGFATGASDRRVTGVARRALTVSLMTGVLAFLNTATDAQQPAPAYSPARPTGQAAAKAAPKAAAKSEAPAASAAPAPGEGGLRNRVEQLEEQLVEMQVAVGTLDSLAKGGGSSSSGVYRGGGQDAAAGGGGDPGRVAALETQVRALATQVDQLTQQIRQMNARGPAQSSAVAPLAAATLPPPLASVPAASAQGAADASDPIGRLVGTAGTRLPATAAAPQADTVSLPQAGAGDASSKQAYETAYGHLLQQDFGAAETAFDDFLKRFPSDPLAGNAQYWLGETYFARGQYKPAASAFLKGYQTYARSAKAPDSVLKLAMSLDKLGQKDAACASYAELTTKFPNAPGHVKNRADTERRRLGCA